jgi:hypothetical protein
MKKITLFGCFLFLVMHVYSQSIFFQSNLVNIRSVSQKNDFPNITNINSSFDIGFKLDLKKEWSTTFSVGRFQLINNELNNTYSSSSFVKSSYIGGKIGLRKTYKLSTKSKYYVEAGLTFFNNYKSTETIEVPRIINTTTKNGNEFSGYSKLGVIIKLTNRVNFDFALSGQGSIISNININSKKITNSISNLSTTIYYSL